MPRALFIFLSGLIACAAPSPLPAQSGLEQNEMTGCQLNLRIIYEALQAYRRDNRELPKDLPELIPRYLAESSYLVCPAARRSGITSSEAVGTSSSRQIESPATYVYEFTPTRIPPAIGGGSSRTMREWKQLQMGLVGSEVPIVRCFTHEPAVLNLSFGGRVYESGLDWELNYEDVIDARDLSHGRRLAAYTRVKRMIIPRRDAKASSAQVDLFNYYNRSLDETWNRSDSFRPLARLPVGLAELDGVTFDLRGAIQLEARSPELMCYPSSVSNIVIGLPASRVYLLLATVYETSPGEPVADCVFHFASDRTDRFRIRYGMQLLSCVAHSPVAEPRNGHLAWTDPASGNQVTARLYRCEWINPNPGDVITTMDFIGLHLEAGPLLVALSVGPRG